MKKISKFFRYELIFFGLILLFILISLLSLKKIGPEYDELIPVNAAINCPNSSFLIRSIYIKSQCIPIMLSSYLGGSLSIPYKLSFIFFSPNVLVFRLTSLSIIILSLFLLFITLKKTFNSLIASLTLFFLVFDSQFFLTQLFEGATNLPFLIRVFFLNILFTLKETLSKYLLLGLIIGFGIYTKLDASFFFFSILISLICININIKKFRKDLKTNFLKFLFLFAGLIIGLSPFLFFILRNKDIFSLVRSVGEGSESIIGQKISDWFLQLLPQNWFYYIFMEKIYIPSAIKLLAILLTLIWLFASFKLISNKKYRFLSLSFIIFLGLYFSYRGLISPHHRVLIYPIPQIILAIFLVSLKSKRVMFFVIASYLVIYIFSFWNFVIISSKNCGVRSASCHIYNLYDYLKNGNKNILIGDWGISNQLLLLSKGKLNLNEVSYTLNDVSIQNARKYLEPLLSSCPTLILYRNEKSIFTLSNKNIREILKDYPQYQPESVDEYQIFRCNKKAS